MLLLGEHQLQQTREDHVEFLAPQAIEPPGTLVALLDEAGGRIADVRMALNPQKLSLWC